MRKPRQFSEAQVDKCLDMIRDLLREARARAALFEEMREALRFAGVELAYWRAGAEWASRTDEIEKRLDALLERADALDES